MTEPLLEVNDLVVEYQAGGLRRRAKQVLHEVSLDVRPGETVGLVGESGSGKSTLGRAVLGLVPVASGSIRFRGEEISAVDRRQRRTLAREIQVVFQDPYTSLNPNLTVAQTLTEPLTANGMAGDRARGRVQALLDAVHLPKDAAERYPQEFSGGQRQRVAIARALAMEPSLIVCDEPVSALDLTTQRRVLDLLLEIQERTGVAYLFVSHDLAVVRHLSHRVAVMERGRIVEWGECSQVTRHPSHEYTRTLLAASPIPHPVLQAAHRAARHR